MLTKLLDKAINKFLSENGQEPTFIIMNPGTYGDLCYEMGLKKGLKEDEAHFYDITEYNFINIAIAVKQDFKDFELR